jgi:hypothetical protein
MREARSFNQLQPRARRSISSPAERTVFRFKRPQCSKRQQILGWSGADQIGDGLREPKGPNASWSSSALHGNSACPSVELVSKASVRRCQRHLRPARNTQDRFVRKIWIVSARSTLASLRARARVRIASICCAVRARGGRGCVPPPSQPGSAVARAQTPVIMLLQGLQDDLHRRTGAPVGVVSSAYD